MDDNPFVQFYRDAARRSVAAHRTQWWEGVAGVGEKTARNMLRADLESYRYAKRAMKVWPKLPEFKWRFNK